MTHDRKAPHIGATELSDRALDSLFAAARAAEPEALDADFQARLLSGAAQAQKAHTATVTRTARWARLRALLSDFGGMPGVASMGVAGLAGVWIGFAEPAGSSTWLTQIWQGAAQISPTVSRWVAPQVRTTVDDGLIAVLSGDLE